jgi:hypothetical protein
MPICLADCLFRVGLGVGTGVTLHLAGAKLQVPGVKSYQDQVPLEVMHCKRTSYSCD